MKVYICSAGDRKALDVPADSFVPYFEITEVFTYRQDPARDLRKVYGAMLRGGMSPIIARHYLTRLLHNQASIKYHYPKEET